MFADGRVRTLRRHNVITSLLGTLVALAALAALAALLGGPVLRRAAELCGDDGD
jgi:hypothetical protein